MESDFTTKPPNILIVDDSPPNLLVLGQMLSDNGFTARPATSGQQALDAAKLFPPDLILLDVLMPDIDGIETCNRLKADPDLKDIPVIFLSALDNVEHKILAFRAGGVDYVTKPFHTEEVLARIRTHLELVRLRAQDQIHIQQLSVEIEKREQVEATLRRSEQRFRTLANTVPAVIWITDSDGMVSYLNLSWKHMTGQDIENAMGPGWIDFVHEEDRERYQAEFAEALATQDAFQSKLRFLYEDGEYRWVASYGVPRYDAQNTFVGYIGSWLDINDRVALEQHQTQLALEKSRRDLINNFIVDISHEFRTPLSVIGVSSYLAKKRTDNVEIQQSIGKIEQSAEELTKLIDTMLKVLRLENRLPVYQPVDLNTIVLSSRVISNIHTDPARVSQIQLSLADSLPEIRGEPEAIDDAVTELLNNAFRFSEQDPLIRVTTQVSDGAVMLSVQDNGIGMSEDVITSAFDSFYREDEAHQVRGMGLGLTIVKKVMELHDGDIEVESEIGEGTCVTLLFPIT